MYYYLLLDDEKEIAMLISADNVYPNEESAHPEEVYKFKNPKKIVSNIDDSTYDQILNSGGNVERITDNRHLVLRWLFEGQKEHQYEP